MDFSWNRENVTSGVNLFDISVETVSVSHLVTWLIFTFPYNILRHEVNHWILSQRGGLVDPVLSHRLGTTSVSQTHKDQPYAALFRSALFRLMSWSVNGNKLRLSWALVLFSRSCPRTFDSLNGYNVWSQFLLFSQWWWNIAKSVVKRRSLMIDVSALFCHCVVFWSTEPQLHKLKLWVVFYSLK